MANRIVIKPATVALILVGILLVIVAIVYFATPAKSLPGFVLPGASGWAVTSSPHPRLCGARPRPAGLGRGLVHDWALRRSTALSRE